MNFSKLVFILSLLFLFSCNKDGDYPQKGNWPMPGPDPGSNQFVFEWLTGHNDITGYPFLSEQHSPIFNNKYHVGYTFKIIQDAGLPDNTIISYSVIVWSPIGNLYSDKVFTLDIDSITVIYNGCYTYLDTTIYVPSTRQIKYSIEVQCQEYLYQFGWGKNYSDNLYLDVKR